MASSRSAIIRAAGRLGGFPACRWLSRATPKILMYHRFAAQPAPGFVDRDTFRRQVAYLQRHFRICSLGQVLAELHATGRCATNTAVITVDDGYRDFYEVAWPVLQQSRAPATLFLATHFIDGRIWLWPDALRHILDQSTAIRQVGIPGFEGQQYLQLNDVQRSMLWLRMVDYLLSIPEDDKRDWINRFAARQGVVLAARPKGACQAVSWDQVREMQAGGIEIGAHTRTHPSLGRVDAAALVGEISGSVGDIERETGRRPVSFCYPNGQRADYSEAAKAQVRAAGCLGAVTAFYDSAVIDDLYEIRRFSASENTFQFEKSANGVELMAARWLNTSNHSTGYAG